MNKLATLFMLASLAAPVSADWIVLSEEDPFTGNKQCTVASRALDATQFNGKGIAFNVNRQAVNSKGEYMDRIGTMLSRAFIGDGATLEADGKTQIKIDDEVLDAEFSGLVEKAKAGTTMVVRTTSDRGKTETVSVSLVGFTKAWEKAETACEQP